VTSRIVRLRFPNGESEVRSLGKLQEGAVVRLRGASWVVAWIDDDIVQLAPQAFEDNGNGGAGSGRGDDAPMILDAPLTA
jgi:hypothetical protein